MTKASRNNRYDTLSQATTDLKNRGFTVDFDVHDDKLCSKDNDSTFKPGDCRVAEYHRFEGMTDPGDMSIIYALETKDGTKGTLITAYGSEKNYDDFIKKLNIDEG